MRFTEISDYDARPGPVTEWTLHPATVTAADVAREDSRSPSYLQQAHLLTAASHRDFGVDAPTWLATAFDLPSPIDRDALEAAFVEWMTRHETLRSGFRFSGERPQRFTLPADSIAFEQEFVGDFHRQEDLQRYLEDRFDEVTNPLAWPTFLFVTVHRDDATTVYLAFDHTNVDGYSMCLIPQEIRELYFAARAGRRAELTEVGSYVDFAEAERAEAARVDNTHPAVARWRKFMADSGGRQPVFPLDLGTSTADLPRQTSVCEWLLDAADAETVETVCQESAGSFLSGVLAAAGIAGYELADCETYRAVTAFHTRCEPQWMRSMGWYVGLAPIEFSLGDARDFRDLVEPVRESARAVRSMAEVPFGRVCELLGSASLPSSVLSYMDLRSLPGADSWTEWRTHVFGKVSVGNEVYVWVIRTQEGVFVASRHPDTDIACKNVQHYIAQLREILNTVAITGNYVLADRVPTTMSPDRKGS